jgi:cobyrinic acid a,c-diamide synthase
VVLPGGYPELHAPALEAAGRSLADLRRAARSGVPLVAECGGLLLLGEGLTGPEGSCHAMAGLLPFTATRGALSLGYRTATAVRDGLLLRAGETLQGHEFHRWQICDSQRSGPDVVRAEGLWQLEGWGSPRRQEGWTNAGLHASWLHLHWAGFPAIPWRLAAAAARAAPLPPAPTPAC